MNEDINYLKKLAQKVIAEDDGKVPAKQLYPADYDKWEGVNLQGYCQTKPYPDQEEIALYIIDADQKLSKRFTVTKSMLYLLFRGTERIFYGTTSPEGKQTKIILQWEKEQREDPSAPKPQDGMRRKKTVKKKRPIYPKIDISGLDTESRHAVLKALAEAEKQK